MSSKDKDSSEETVRLRRPPPRVFTDPTGRSVWMGEVEVLELELVEVADGDPYNTADAKDPSPGT